MKKVFLFIFIFITTIVSVDASFNDLPADLVIKIGQYLEPKDAGSLVSTNRKMAALSSRIRSVQLPNLYARIGKDFSESLIQFDHPQWQIVENMPPVMRMLVHDWYFRGLKTTDPYKRFCYMMAAGRAGHHYAAVEAGQLLLDSDVAVIPCLVTLEDLMRVVPELSDPMVQGWDICKLNRELIDDREVREIRKAFRLSIDQIIEDGVGLLKNPESTEQIISFFEDFLGNAESKLDCALVQLKALKSISDENIVIQDDLILMRQIFKKLFYKAYVDDFTVIFDDFHHLDMDNPNLKEADKRQAIFYKNHGEEILKHMQNKCDESISIDIQEFTLKNSAYVDLPCYWDYLASYYEQSGALQKQMDALQHILSLRINGETCGDLADCLYELNSVKLCLDVDNLKAVVTQARGLHLMSVLLDETNDLDAFEVEYYHADKIPGYLRQQAGDDLLKQEEVYDFFQAWQPMEAFALQLAALRRPDQRDVYDEMESFYGQSKWVAGIWVADLNDVRSNAAGVLMNELEQEIQSALEQEDSEEE